MSHVAHELSDSALQMDMDECVTVLDLGIFASISKTLIDHCSRIVLVSGSKICRISSIHSKMPSRVNSMIQHSLVCYIVRVSQLSSSPWVGFTNLI